MLRVGVIGEDAVAGRDVLRECDREQLIAVDALEGDAEQWPTRHLVVGVGGVASPDLARAADVWVEDVALLDELWRVRVRPFANNLAARTRAPRARVAVLRDPDPTWPAQAQRLVARLRRAVGDAVQRIDHIGSTSVPMLAAKDLIDIQMVVADLEVAAAVADAAHDAGFVRVHGDLSCVDQHGVGHPEAVVVDADPGRPVNVNIRPVGAPIWRETLLLRDWLRAEPAARQEYEAMKRSLAARPEHDVDEYGRDKYPWIAAATTRASAWANACGWSP